MYAPFLHAFTPFYFTSDIAHLIGEPGSPENIIPLGKMKSQKLFSHHLYKFFAIFRKIAFIL